MEERHQEIMNCLASIPVTSQGAIVEFLKAKGFEVTQSSVSRDLQHLGVIKVEGVYQAPAAEAGYAAGVRGVIPAGDNLIVIRTVTGGGSRIGYLLDGAHIPEIIGTIAGDDTVFAAVANKTEQRRVMRQMIQLFQGEGI